MQYDVKSRRPVIRSAGSATDQRREIRSMPYRVNAKEPVGFNILIVNPLRTKNPPTAANAIGVRSTHPS